MARGRGGYGYRSRYKSIYDDEEQTTGTGPHSGNEIVPFTQTAPAPAPSSGDDVYKMFADYRKFIDNSTAGDSYGTAGQPDAQQVADAKQADSAISIMQKFGFMDAPTATNKGTGAKETTYTRDDEGNVIAQTTKPITSESAASSGGTLSDQDKALMLGLLKSTRSITPPVAATKDANGNTIYTNRVTPTVSGSARPPGRRLLL
jgi:hypothetical protein